MVSHRQVTSDDVMTYCCYCDFIQESAAEPTLELGSVAISHASINSRMVHLTTRQPSRRPACPSEKTSCSCGAELGRAAAELSSEVQQLFVKQAEEEYDDWDWELGVTSWCGAWLGSKNAVQDRKAVALSRRPEQRIIHILPGSDMLVRYKYVT
eukprot:scaffold8313_cov77-Skeletonema_dohrnii-CCMP3373.AAC.1